MRQGQGRRVLVTRPLAQALRQRETLQACGFEAEVLPLIQIDPVADQAPVQAVWSGLADWDWLFFVSPNAVQHFFAARLPGLSPAWPKDLQVGALGPGTLQALQEAGVPLAQVTTPAPKIAQVDSEALWQRLALQHWARRRVLVVRGDGGRDWLAEQLRAHDADVSFLQAYVRGLPRWDAAQRQWLHDALAEPERQVWLFSSSQSIDHLQQLCPQGHAVWPRSTAVASHPRIAERARAAGFGQVLSSAPDPDAVAACIQSAAW